MSDVLIIGAGSAGSILAERLSGDPGCTVTVVEAGPAPSDPRVEAQITDGLRLPIGAASSVVRHYPSVLTENPPRHTEIIRGSVVGGSGAVNGGYFCLRSSVFDVINEGEELVEQPFQRLLKDRKLIARRHEGFWAAMDTFKDKIAFDRMEARGACPWMVWRQPD